MYLILFDVDGTLLHCGPQVRPVFASALAEVFGETGRPDGYDFAGKTDPQIVLDLLTAAGIPKKRIEAGLPKVKEVYLRSLDRVLDRDGMKLLPGVVELLEDLAAREDVVLGLLTGNWESGARIKLSRFDLNRFFAFGAFGDGQRERRGLPPLALERAERLTGRRFTPRQTLIVGDSLLDVDCARAHGIPALAVATGGTPVSALETAGADWVVSDLAAARNCHPALAA